MTTDPRKPLSRASQLIHGGTRRSAYGEMSEAIFLTQGFVYDTAESAQQRFEADDLGDLYIYARYGNPTVAMFEDRMAGYEGAEAGFATASGMAAVNGAVFSQVQAGDHVVASKALFGSCLYIIDTLLRRFGVEVTLVEGTDLQAWRDALSRETKVVFFESPSNPMMEVVDIAAVSELAHAAGACVVVDNVFATPLFQSPLELGADVVVYSATKHIDGQGRCLGGIVLGRKSFIRGDLQTYMKHTGGSMSPFNAWVLLKSLETLELRVRAQSETARILASLIADHPALLSLTYPGRPDHPQAELIARQMKGGSSLITFCLKEGQAGAFRFLNALRLFQITNNLGDAKSLATYPGTTTHQRLSEAERLALGIHPGTVRISCGLEAVDDLGADLNQALSAV
ncbi:O-succinylhomoserine sulfhydrylase [Roseovarius sp. C7]|uniref:O-succinylhomoserine sulfhydrylase n=1 Tax=Roseovarius sp. C7 TaxID=3398643 RepID=UPI0039F6824B